MLIDCNECTQQHTETCQNCVVTQVLRDIGGPLEIDADQADALEVLVEAGLVAPLRLVVDEQPDAAAS